MELSIVFMPHNGNKNPFPFIAGIVQHQWHWHSTHFLPHCWSSHWAWNHEACGPNCCQRWPFRPCDQCCLCLVWWKWGRKALQQGVCVRHEAKSYARSGEAKRHWHWQDIFCYRKMCLRHPTHYFGRVEKDWIDKSSMKQLLCLWEEPSKSIHSTFFECPNKLLVLQNKITRCSKIRATLRG